MVLKTLFKSESSVLSLKIKSAVLYLQVWGCCIAYISGSGVVKHLKHLQFYSTQSRTLLPSGADTAEMCGKLSEGARYNYCRPVHIAIHKTAFIQSHHVAVSSYRREGQTFLLLLLSSSFIILLFYSIYLFTLLACCTIGSHSNETES